MITASGLSCVSLHQKVVQVFIPKNAQSVSWLKCSQTHSLPVIHYENCGDECDILKFALPVNHTESAGLTAGETHRIYLALCVNCIHPAAKIDGIRFYQFIRSLNVIRCIWNTFAPFSSFALFVSGLSACLTPSNSPLKNEKIHFCSRQPPIKGLIPGVLSSDSMNCRSNS